MPISPPAYHRWCIVVDVLFSSFLLCEFAHPYTSRRGLTFDRCRSCKMQHVSSSQMRRLYLLSRICKIFTIKIREICEKVHIAIVCVCVCKRVHIWMLEWQIVLRMINLWTAVGLPERFVLPVLRCKRSLRGKALFAQRTREILMSELKRKTPLVSIRKR